MANYFMNHSQFFPVAYNFFLSFINHLYHIMDENSDGIGHNQPAHREGCFQSCFCFRIGPPTRNVLQLGVGFFFILLAFNSQGFIEESVLDSYARRGIGVELHDGYTSLAIIYGSFTVLNFVAAPIVGLLDTRWALVFGGLAYAIFLAGFLFINRWFLFCSSALLGLGAAVIWTAQGKYLALNSTKETAGKHSGLFWALSQACQSCGGLFLLAVFWLSPSATGGSSAISPPTVRLLYGAFTGLTLLGIGILCLLRIHTEQPIRRRRAGSIPSTTPSSELAQPIATATDQNDASAPDQRQRNSHLDTLKSTFRLVGTRRMVPFALVFMYTGISQSFWSSIYPTTIGNTELFQMNQAVNPKILLALTAIVQGLGQTSSGFLFGILDAKTRRFGRSRIVGLGAVLQLISFGLTYLNLPSHAPLEKTFEHGVLLAPSITIALISGFLLSFGDACWNTQIFITLIAKYPVRTAQAFAVFKFFQSLLCCAAFFYATSLSLEWHLLILVIGSLIGFGAFLLVECMPNQQDDDDQDHDNGRMVVD